LQLWKQTLITRDNLEKIAEKSGVTQASHYQEKRNFIEQAGLNKDPPYGALLTTQDWKEFSSVGFFSKQKLRFLFSRGTKATRVFDDAFATFHQSYSSQIIKTDRAAQVISAASGEAKSTYYDRIPGSAGGHDSRTIELNLRGELVTAQHEMDQRWEQLRTSLDALKVWLKAKQESGTSTRLASVLHLYHLALIEQRTVASERDRLGPSRLHSGNRVHKAEFDRSNKPQAWELESVGDDGRGNWVRRLT
jgi:hypothetical protein